MSWHIKILIKNLKNKPGFHWSPSPPHNKQRHPDFGNDWPVRYAQIHRKTAQHLGPIIPLHFITLSTTLSCWFCKKLSNIILLVNNIILMSCDWNVTLSTGCRQTLQFQEWMPVLFCVIDTTWWPLVASNWQDRHFKLLGNYSAINTCLKAVESSITCSAAWGLRTSVDASTDVLPNMRKHECCGVRW